jgi:hypothetical protein
MNLKSFNQLKKEVNESKNKVAFLIDIFMVLHSDAPPDDFEKLGGRMAGILNQAGKDPIIVLQAIWKSSADGIVASHLNFIQGMIKNKVSGFCQQPSRFDKALSSSPSPRRLSAQELLDKEKQEER